MSMGHGDGWHPTAPRPDHSGGPAGPQHQATPVRPLVQGAAAPGPGAPRLEPQFDARGMQSVLTRARDHSRFEAPVVEEEAQRRPLPVRGLLAGLVAILLLGIFAGFAYVTWFRPSVDDPKVIVKPTATNSQQVSSTTPQEVVSRYFDALAAGDIELALAMGPRGTGSEALISPAVFARTAELGRISDVEILTTDPEATEVEVRYQVGGEQVDATMQLNRTDSGAFQLTRTTLEVRIQFAGSGSVPLLINGQQVQPGQTYELVPGRYDMTTGLPFVDYPSANDFTVRSLWRADLSTQTATPELTEAGRSAFLDAARRSLNTCLASSSAQPEGCPVSVQVRKQPQTLQWHLDNAPFSNARATLSADDQAYAVLAVNIAAHASMTFADGSTSAGTTTVYTATAQAAMTGTPGADVWGTWN